MIDDCTQFWNLYSNERHTKFKDPLKDDGFKEFSSNVNDHINWLRNSRGSSEYSRYWRVYYRTWDDFFSICKTSYDKNDCYNELVSYSNNCKNSDQRFTNNCKNACDEIWTDGTIRNNCAQGLINYSSNCKNGNQRYNDNCKFTCDPKWTDGNLQENCNYGIAQWCNDDDNYKNILQVKIQKEFKVTPHYLEIEHDVDFGYKMGVYLCVGQAIHTVSYRNAVDISVFKNFRSIQEHITENGRAFIFMGEGQHKIKRKAEQIACEEAIKFIEANDNL